MTKQRRANVAFDHTCIWMQFNPWVTAGELENKKKCSLRDANLVLHMREVQYYRLISAIKYNINVNKKLYINI